MEKNAGPENKNGTKQLGIEKATKEKMTKSSASMENKNVKWRQH